MKLQARGTASGFDAPRLLRMRDNAANLRDSEALLCKSERLPESVNDSTIVAPHVRQPPRYGLHPILCDVPDFDYLAEGDVVAVRPDGFARVLYRRASPHNSIFVTDQCNSYCVMCSQPPKVINDRGRVAEILELIDLIDPSTTELGVTGGEPTLFGRDFLRIVQRAKDCLPKTALHVLTNGRLFYYRSFARALADVGHPDLMLGIPLYSSVDWQHDL